VFIFGAINAWLAGITSLVGLVAAGGAAKLADSGYCFVQEGQLGAMKFCGKAVRYRRGPKKGQLKIYYPGWCFPVPGIRKLARINIRRAPLHSEVHTYMLADHTVFSCGGAGMYVISEHETALEQALFGTTDLHDLLHTCALSVRMRVLATKSYSALSGQPYDELRKELAGELQREVGEWGVKILSFELIATDPDWLTNLRIQTPDLVAVNTAAVKKAAAELDLTDRKELLPALAAGLIPGTSGFVTTTTSSPQQLPSATNGNGDGVRNGNGHQNGKVPPPSALHLPSKLS
jgi:hypothetical protein